MRLKILFNGLKIKPGHNGINEYLGELYIKTNRMDLAKERLEVLENCNCKEYAELKALIEKLILNYIFLKAAKAFSLVLA